MKDKIVALIHDTIIEKGGIYTTLFGSTELEKQTTLNINWVFKNSELKESVEIVLDHIISQVLQSYKVGKYDKDKHFIAGIEYKAIVYDNETTSNWFLPINYEIIDSEIHFADIENYISDIEIIENGPYVYFKWSFPVYKISNDSLISF